MSARASTFDEPPELLPRTIWVGSRILAAGEAFFFVAFLFAFFYLRALDSNGVWRGWPHHHPHPSKAFGIAILVCVVASAGALRGAAGPVGRVGMCVVGVGHLSPRPPRRLPARAWRRAARPRRRTRTGRS